MTDPSANQREHAPGFEVTAGNAPVPVWLFVLLGLLIFWAMEYLDDQGGGFHASVYRPHRSFDDLQAMIPRSDEAQLRATGQRLYNVYCIVCHQSSGLGSAGQFPPLAQSEWLLTEGADRIIRIVLNGLHGPISVRGQNYNGAMPPLGSDLDDEEIAAILSYVRQNQNWGNNASPVAPQQIGAVRAETVNRRSAWTAAELLKIPDAPGQ
jgi:mono/diheme cytochrome c family protein